MRDMFDKFGGWNSRCTVPQNPKLPMSFKATPLTKKETPHKFPTKRSTTPNLSTKNTSFFTKTTKIYTIKMSSSQTPISPARFAEAIRDLTLSTLSLKVFELRNSIAHLDYSNEELKPFAAGTNGGEPDLDCVDAIRENEVVIKRMLERIELLKVEVETRGASWEELGGERKEEKEEIVEGEGTVPNGSTGEERSSAWTDGTFQTGRFVNGEVRMDDAPAATAASSTNGVSGSTTAVSGTANGAGGRLDDEALRRAMEERMRNLGQDDDDEGGMHL